MVFLYAPDGSIYWGWSGPATSVHVGGSPVLDDDSSGPRVAAGMNWAVIANDPAMLPIAASDLRSIEP